MTLGITKFEDKVMQHRTIVNHDDADVTMEIDPENTPNHETVKAAEPAGKVAATARNMAESYVDNEPLEPQPEDACIAIMGMTGAGKSSMTRVLDIYCSCGIFTKTVWLIDTPGFDDTEISDADILREIATFLGRCFEVGIRLSGVIYLHRITDPRMSGSAIKNLELLKLLCGKQAFPIVSLVTTRWNEFAEGSTDFQMAIDRESQLCAGEKFWAPMIEAGSSVFRHGRPDLSSTSIIIESILQGQRKASLAIQTEMVIQKLCLNMTSAGRFLEQEYGKAEQTYERELQEIQVTWEEALRERDQQAMATLDDEKQDLVLQRDRVLQEQIEIQTDFQELRARKIKAVRSKSSKFAHSEPSHTESFDQGGSTFHSNNPARALGFPECQVSSQSSSLEPLDILGDTSIAAGKSSKYTPSVPLRMGTLRATIQQKDQRAIVAWAKQSVKTFFEQWLYS
ncbi:MAG: hypothetical protein Q9181_007961 [Wetmoreana brouardii]